MAEVSLSGTTMTVDIDLGGNVFGQADPPPETFTIDTAAVAAGGAAVDSEVFGPMTITVTSANTVEMRADAIPNPRLDGIVSTITFGPNGTATGSYEITSGGATFAEGTVEMEKG